MVQETEYTNWFSRLGGSFKGMIFGLLLFVVSFPLLFWNEGRAVKTAKGLKEGAAAVIQVDSEKVIPENQGKFVHVQGTTSVIAPETLEDTTFGVTYRGIRLERHVQMYQWNERVSSKQRERLGGGVETIKTYTYQQNWSSSLSSSDSFKEPVGHENPASMPFSKKMSQATDVRLGDFQLPSSLIAKIVGEERVSIQVEHLPQDIAQKIDQQLLSSPSLEKLYIPASSENGESGGTPESPKIGDVRVWFSGTPAGTVSVMSRQIGSSFEPFITQQKTQLHMLSMGTVSPEAMIAKAQEQNRLWTWLLRILGIGIMFGGLKTFLNPLKIIAGVVPFIGSIVGAGTSLIAGLITLALAPMTIGLAWVFYRPLIGIPLFGLAAVGLFFLIRLLLNQRRQGTA